MMKKVGKEIGKIIGLGKIKSIVCNDCKEIHHLGEDFLKIVGISDKELNVIASELEKEFRKYHYNHNVEIKEMPPFAHGYKVFLIPFNFDIGV